ncbi:unnamed protein product [Victoria cruziana]
MADASIESTRVIVYFIYFWAVKLRPGTERDAEKLQNKSKIEKGRREDTKKEKVKKENGRALSEQGKEKRGEKDARSAEETEEKSQRIESEKEKEKKSSVCARVRALRTGDWKTSSTLYRSLSGERVSVNDKLHRRNSRNLSGRAAEEFEE